MTLPQPSDNAQILLDTLQQLETLQNRYYFCKLAKIFNKPASIPESPTIQEIQGLIDHLKDKSWESLPANQAAAYGINSVIRRFDLAFKCPKCGLAAGIRCQKSGRAKNGMFQIIHSRLNNRKGVICKSYSTFPPLELTPAPPDRRRRSQVKP